MVLKYKVIMMPNAKDDLDEILGKIAEISHFAGSVKKWHDKIMDLVDSLDYMPERFPVFRMNRTYHLARVGKYVVLYRVDGENKRILVMRIVYARRDLGKVLG